MLFTKQNFSKDPVRSEQRLPLGCFKYKLASLLQNPLYRQQFLDAFYPAVLDSLAIRSDAMTLT